MKFLKKIPIPNRAEILDLVLGKDEAARLDRLDRAATLMDAKWRIPGTGFRFGLDAVVGLVPIAGDAIGVLVSGYIISQALAFGVPWWLAVRMALNVAIDFAVGFIPFVDVIFDVGFKANRANVELLKDHLARRRAVPDHIPEHAGPTLELPASEVTVLTVAPTTPTAAKDAAALRPA